MRPIYLFLLVCAGFALRDVYQRVTAEEIVVVSPPSAVSLPFPAPWKEPNQRNVAGPQWRYGSYQFKALAEYSVTALVGGTERYRYDEGAKLAPVDLLLCWGRCADKDLVKQLGVSQSGRWYEWHTWREPPLPVEEIGVSMANTHIIPATKQVRQQILDLDRYDKVQLSGYLVAISGPGGWHWISSLTRTDRGGGACELFWVQSVRKLP